MRFLHLTDLHYTENSPFQIDLIKALIDDLKIQLDKIGSLNLVVFSGDIVNNPDDQNIYTAFEENFLALVLSTLGLAKTDVVFCPGNHDVSQKALKDWADERAKTVAALSTQDALSKYLDTGPAKAYLAELSSGFYSLVDRCGAKWNSPLAHVYNFPNHKASFVALNSAIGCGLEGSAYDRGKLAIPADVTLAAFQNATSGHLVFSLMHHTVSDINEEASSAVIPIISKYSNAHFFGHVHQPRPVVEVGPGTACFMIQGGALYENERVFNGYSIVEVGPKNEIAARYRTYYKDRMTFDVGTNVNQEGVFYNSSAAESYWKKLVAAPDNDDVCLWLLETADGVLRELDKTITPRSLVDTFVDPVISLASDEDGSTSNALVTPEQILQGTNNLIIASDAEYGATSLLSYLAIQYHKECLTLPIARVPIFVDGRRIRDTYPALVTSTLRGGLPDSNNPYFKLQYLHDSGRLVVLIDDIDPTNSVHVSFLGAVRKQYPKSRFVVAVKLPFIDTHRLKPALGVDDFAFAQIGTLSRGKVRSLVEKWQLPSRYQTNTVVDEIHSRFLALGIPQTAAYVVIYLSVLQEIDGFNPINSSTVIEQFVEGALQKYKPVYIFRSAFDYRNQIDYLGVIAERMCRKNSFFIEYSELYAWTQEYFESIGIEHNYPKLIEHFISVKVFEHEGNSVYFKYNIFLSFFIAHRMTRSNEFKQWLTEKHRYTNYITEIDIYCGLSRQDTELLEFFAAEFARLSEKLEEYVRPLAWTDRLEKLSIPIVKKTDTEAFTESINRQLTSDMPAEKRDEIVSKSVAQQKTVTPDYKRPEVIGTLPLWILTLRAFTVSLKNLENISKEEKETNLTKVLQGWSTIILYACIIFKDLIEKRVIDIGPMKFKLDLPEDFDARLLRLLFLSIPVYISDQLRRDLGSQKLSLQLRNHELAPTLSDAFLQTGLYADLKLNEYLGQLKLLRDKAAESGSHVILEALLMKMRDIFLRLGLQPDEQDGFIRVAAEISADLNGLEGVERQREIDRYSTDLRRHDQVNKIRENMQ